MPEYTYKLSIRSFEDPSNSKVLNILPVDKSYNETHHTILAEDLQPNTLYSLFIVAEANGKEALRSNELSIRTTSADNAEGGKGAGIASGILGVDPGGIIAGGKGVSTGGQGGEGGGSQTDNNSGSDGGDNQGENQNNTGAGTGIGAGIGAGAAAGQGQGQGQTPFGQQNAPGPFIRFFNKSTFSLDKPGKSSVSNGTPGILRMDEFKERFVVNDQDLDKTREVFIQYWFIPSIAPGKMPISNPTADEYRAPCNTVHRDLLKASFGKYVEFLKRNGAVKPANARSSEEDAYSIELERVNLYLSELNKTATPHCITEGESKSKIVITGKVNGKGNYYKFLPDMFYLAYMQAKNGGGANLDAAKIFEQYSGISGMSVDELLDKIKKDDSGSDNFDHNISAGLLRLLTFLQEKYPKVYNKIMNKDKANTPLPTQSPQKGGVRESYSKMFEPIVEQENAWRKLNHDYHHLSPEHKSILPPPPNSPIIETVEPLRKYIDNNADNESLNEARSAIDLLAPDDLEELMKSDSETSPMSRIKPYYEKALPGVGTPWVPIMVRADVLSRVLKDRAN